MKRTDFIPGIIKLEKAELRSSRVACESELEGLGPTETKFLRHLTHHHFQNDQEINDCLRDIVVYSTSSLEITYIVFLFSMGGSLFNRFSLLSGEIERIIST